MQKTMELTDRVYGHLWICESDVYNTVDPVYNCLAEGTGLRQEVGEEQVLQGGERGGFPAKRLLFDWKSEVRILVRRPATG